MFQAKLRGWRRLAAGLVLVPGLTGLGADALGLLGRAAGQDRPPAARTEDAREIMRRAREAYDAGNYGLARELAEKANSMKAPAAFYDDRPDDLLSDLSRKPGGRTMATAPAAAAPTRPATTDPKVLLTLAKQAMDAGDLDRAQDLATQAQATGAHVRWGLFDDTPASVLKDIYKARGRRDRDMSERLLTEARTLLEKPATSKNERTANLGTAEEKARRAGAMHGPYSMWDFGDRPGDVIADVRKAREKERLLAVKPQPSDFPDEPMPKGPTGYAGRKSTPREDRGVAMDTPRQADAAAARKKAAIILMQEGKALEVGFHYAEARRKYVEAARLNAPFSRDEDTPESELTRLTLAAQRHIDSLTAKARSCMDRKDQTAASAHLDEAHAIAIGMGLDATLVVEMRLGMKGPSAVVPTAGKTDDGPAPIIRTGRRPTADETADVAMPPPVKTEDAPPPIIRTGTRPMTDETATSPGDPPPIIRTGRRPMADETADDAPKIKTGAPAPIIRSGNRPMPDETADIAPPPIIKPAAGDEVPKTIPVPLPPIPDVDKLADQAKPPKIVEPAPIIRSNPTPPMSDQGEQLLKIAREELRKGETETTKRICIEVINGPYGCKDEAVALLKTAETKEAEGKIASARRAFENGVDAYQAHNYAQALAIFQQIDGMLLPAEARKKLTEMMELAAAKKKEMDDATANRSTDKLPTAPKVAPGIPDVPPTGPAVAPRVGADNLLKQQEALAQVEFQRLRSKALKVESEATARFGRGETDAALQDLKNFCAEVKASNLEPSKQNMLVRPIEARMDRLLILKHQTDFLTKEAKDRRNFKTEMTHEALAKQAKQEDVAKLMKEATQLMAESKYKEAYVKVQIAHSMDPDDASVNGTMMMAEKLYRMAEIKRADKSQELANWKMMQQWHEYPDVDDKDPLKWSDDKEYRNKVMSRTAAGYGVQRMKTEAEKSIERKMSTPVTVSFKSMPLEAVVEHLHMMTAINFDLDLKALKEGSIDYKQPITTDLKDVSLKSALDIICRQAGLKHLIESEAIRITTPRAATGRQVTKSLSVGDLVVPAPNYGAHPGLTFQETMRMARDAAFGVNRMSNNNTMRTGPGSLPGGTSTGSMMDLAGSPNRMTNTPMDGGASTNTGPSSGTLERELIRLITNTIKPDTWKEMGGEGSIEYFPLGLALVINQSPEVIEEVERLLESLRKLQDLEVSIEVKVVSLAETFYERIGVDFSMGIPTNAKPTGGPVTGEVVSGRFNRNFGGNAIGLQLPNLPTPDLDIPIRPTSFAHAVPPFGGFTNSFADGGISLGLAFLSECQVQMFLEAAQGDTRTNVMQAPKLTALNGTSASMTVGDFQFFVTGITPVMVNGQMVFVPQNVPYLVGQTQPIPPNASIQNGLLNFTPTAPQTPGLGLFIQPVVSADRRFVRLNIQQSFTNLISGSVQTPLTTIITPQFENGGTGQPIPFTQFLQQPRFSNLDTQTVVVVPDGGTVVMGGLKYMTEGRNEFGPPVLSKIPYLNRLFKNVAYGREGRSILIMVTPRVIINREEQERQTGVREDDFVGLIGP